MNPSALDEWAICLLVCAVATVQLLITSSRPGDRRCDPNKQTAAESGGQ